MNPLKRGADPYADADMAANYDQVCLGDKSVTVSGANAASFVSPVNGRVSKIGILVTTGVTVAAAVMTIATPLGDLTFTFTIPISSAGAVQMIDVPEEANNVVNQGDLVTVTSNAGPTAGAVDVVGYVMPFAS